MKVYQNQRFSFIFEKLAKNFILIYPMKKLKKNIRDTSFSFENSRIRYICRLYNIFYIFSLIVPLINFIFTIGICLFRNLSAKEMKLQIIEVFKFSRFYLAIHFANILVFIISILITALKHTTGGKGNKNIFSLLNSIEFKNNLSELFAKPVHRHLSLFKYFVFILNIISLLILGFIAIGIHQNKTQFVCPIVLLLWVLISCFVSLKKLITARVKAKSNTFNQMCSFYCNKRRILEGALAIFSFCVCYFLITESDALVELDHGIFSQINKN